MVANRHTCCFCRKERKHVIIHHSDSDPSNNDTANLIVLCHNCHSRVEGNEGLGRQFSPAEVRAYKIQWETLCTSIGVTEEEVEDEPTPILYQAFRLSANEHVAFDLRKNCVSLNLPFNHDVKRRQSTLALFLVSAKLKSITKGY